MPIKINSLSIIRITTHFVFWIFYYVFIYVQAIHLRENPDYFGIAMSLLLTLPIDILASYYTGYVLLPYYLFKRRYILFGSSLFASAIVLILLQRVIYYYIVYPNFYTSSGYTLPSFFTFNYFYSLLNIYTIVAFFMAIKLLKYWYKNQNRQAELEKENKNSEIALLRNQINPHFLFNTLNNIDTLIMKNQEKASDAVMKLSEIMRYMLHGANTEFVPLMKEIDYLKSYISLQKLRFKNPNFAKLEIKGIEKNRLVTPMLFIPFVENAFKHGAKDAKTESVKIYLTLEKEYIDFEVINSINKSFIQSKDKSSGIGLSNVRRRLDLVYKDKYDLDISTKNDNFIVKLRLKFYDN